MRKWMKIKRLLPSLGNSPTPRFAQHIKESGFRRENNVTDLLQNQDH